ncbi:MULTISPECIES: helix-turn-helix domain-containing protein [unclassified Pseudomonas]|uniref:helix-turn-helix domain-containing protein n=1 Tax=unclassified Pseudomonas TaxID=196821 RepID=UPI001780BB49|nr:MULTISPECIES: helix-turn-helix transcriptional regulator [unclassified Pseudomonas]MBD8598969.1 helix-turn-helix transcriptional regulator [Pseudomonas sp. CFBP 8772]MBD8710107.1 helix-turn-helix transcriptional regulator [Pseudomonas sp. CFBP 13711]MBD8715395.1 helix-turn-helix transcriptional regulator [Pseudomonas sp. CFBP 13715]
MELQESFGITLRAIRLGKGLSQGAVGVNQGYLSELESGLKAPTLPKMASIAKGLGIHPLTLITAVYANLGPEDSQQLLARVEQELKEIAES